MDETAGNTVRDDIGAVRLALSEKRLWAAGLIAALALSEAWWTLFQWGPERLGERWGNAVGDRLGDAAGSAAFVLAALSAFLVLRAVAYLGEMILVRQVADGEVGEVPGLSHAFSSSRHRYLHVAMTLLPWDALRTALIYVPALIIAAWGSWDPRFDQVFLYVLAIVAWLVMLLAAHVLAGIPAVLAARSALLRESGTAAAWREGWGLLRSNTGVCLAAWLQALAAEITFLAVAWPLSVLLPWAAGQLADPIGFAPAQWSVRLLALLLLACGLLVMQTLVQVFRSSLWTLAFLKIKEEKNGGDTRLETGESGDCRA